MSKQESTGAPPAHEYPHRATCVFCETRVYREGPGQHWADSSGESLCAKAPEYGAGSTGEVVRGRHEALSASVRSTDGLVPPGAQRPQACDRLTCTAYSHVHYDEVKRLVCNGCAEPVHFDTVVDDYQHDAAPDCDRITAKRWPAIVTHTFASTGHAYNVSQTSDDVCDGDVLSVPREFVVGIMVSAWPTSITNEHGEFHGLVVADGETAADAWAKLDGGKYRESYRAAVELLTQSGNAALVREV